MTNKLYYYKIYDGSGKFITDWSDKHASEPEFTWTMNGGLSELTIMLSKKIDDFGEQNDVRERNEIRAYIIDQEAPNGKLMWRGYISKYAPISQGDNEAVEVTCLSFIDELAMNYLKISGSYEADYSVGYDTGVIMRDIISKKITDMGGYINCSDSTIETTGNVVGYVFSKNKYIDAINECVKMSPEWWYWYMKPKPTSDKYDYIYFTQRLNYPKHTFTLGREINNLRPYKNIEQVVNRVILEGGIPEQGADKIFSVYNDATSIGKYGQRTLYHNDSQIITQTVADETANAILAEKKDPTIEAIVDVVDSNLYDTGYDIESLTPGDTVRIIANTSLDDTQPESVFYYLKNDLWQISKIDYDLKRATIYLTHYPKSVGEVINKLSTTVDDHLKVEKPSIKLLQYVSRQGGSASSWITPGTTNYNEDDVIVQSGFGTTDETDESPAYGWYNSNVLQVNFPVPFGEIPQVFVSSQSDHAIVNVWVSPTTDYFQVKAKCPLSISVGAGFNWVAIGKKA